MSIAELITDWGGIEQLVAELHETGQVTVEHNVILPGRSGAPRQFFASLGNVLLQTPLIIAAPTDASALLRDWKASRVPVYFDVGDSESTDPVRFGAPTLWRLNPNAASGTAYLSPVAKSSFVGIALQGIDFEQPFTKELDALVERLRKQEAFRSRGPSLFDRQMAPTRGRRRL
jgi:competence protein CoiA